MIAVIGLWLCIGLLALAILAIVVAGLRGLARGNVDVRKVGSMVLPVVIWIVMLLITGSWVTAGLATVVIMLAIMILTIVGTGVRGVFS